MHRLFVALRPPAAMRDRLLATMVGVPGARWQDDEQLHLTLRFIGAVDRHQAADVVAALGAVHGETPTIAIEGVGRFGSPRPHSLWAGVPADPALLHLHRSIDRALVRVGLEPERRAFRPHITVARLSRGAGPVDPWLAVHAGLHAPAVQLAHFTLYESHLGSEGARYEAVERFSLG
jgi:RNA 2',3'-cyclic 3'-phosphodiesterase